MDILERLAGIVCGILLLLMLGIVGVVMFLPDLGRYLRIKSM